MSNHYHGQPHHYPPGSGAPPPPYNPPYPAHLHPPGGYAYVPAPVMMPMPVPGYPPHPEPQPAPTYVTNHYYPPQEAAPTPVHVVDSAEPIHQSYQEMIDWIPSTSSNARMLSHKAVVAGKEGWDNSPLWVIRAHHNGNLVPGKLAINHRSAYIPIGGKEVPVHNFEVLTAPAHTYHWLSSSNGQVPVGAIVGGNTHTGEPLYIGRTRHARSITPGKVHPSHGCLYISFGGSEIPYKTYEVLCRIVG